MHKRYKSMTFKDSIKRSFTGYAIMLILILVLLFSTFMIIYNQIILVNFNKNANSQMSSIVNKQYNIYYNETNSLSKDKNIKHFLKTGQNEDKIYKVLYDFTNRQKIKCLFSILDSSGNIFATNLSSKNLTIFTNIEESSEFFKSVYSNPYKVTAEINRIQYDYGQQSDFSFGKAITDGNKVIGYIIFDVLDSDLNTIVYNDNVSISVMTDKYDNVIVTNNNVVCDVLNKFRIKEPYEKFIHIGNESYYIFKNESEDSGIKFFTLTSMRNQNELFLMFIVFISIVGMLMIVLINLFANIVSRKNTSSIDKLIYGINQFQSGNMDYRVDLHTGDEFEILGSEYNRMICELQSLLKKNTELTDRKRIAELKQLESQFNPHFIFNVLETLKYVIMTDTKKAVKMIISLSKLLRYSINYGNTEVPLRNDIEYIKNYLLLQKVRYNKRLQYNIDIEESLMDCMIPKLLIQPIVENCLVHGYYNIECLTINIIGHAVENDLEIAISDNGSGIDDKKLKRIMALFEDENASPNHIGMYNVHRMLKLLYGDDYGLKINSSLNKGTQVILRIPIKHSKGDENSSV